MYAYALVMKLLITVIFGMRLVQAAPPQCASLLQSPQGTFKTTQAAGLSELNELESELSELEEVRMRHDRPQRPIANDLKRGAGRVENRLRLTETTQEQSHARASKSMFVLNLQLIR